MPDMYRQYPLYMIQRRSWLLVQINPSSYEILFAENGSHLFFNPPPPFVDLGIGLDVVKNEGYFRYYYHNCKLFRIPYRKITTNTDPDGLAHIEYIPVKLVQQFLPENTFDMNAWRGGFQPIPPQLTLHSLDRTLALSSEQIEQLAKEMHEKKLLILDHVASLEERSEEVLIPESENGLPIAYQSQVYGFFYPYLENLKLVSKTDVNYCLAIKTVLSGHVNDTTLDRVATPDTSPDDRLAINNEAIQLRWAMFDSTIEKLHLQKSSECLVKLLHRDDLIPTESVPAFTIFLKEDEEGATAYFSQEGVIYQRLIEVDDISFPEEPGLSISYDRFHYADFVDFIAAQCGIVQPEYPTIAAVQRYMIQIMCRELNLHHATLDDINILLPSRYAESKKLCSEEPEHGLSSEDSDLLIALYRALADLRIVETFPDEVKSALYVLIDHYIKIHRYQQNHLQSDRIENIFRDLLSMRLASGFDDHAFIDKLLLLRDEIVQSIIRDSVPVDIIRRSGPEPREMIRLLSMLFRCNVMTPPLIEIARCCQYKNQAALALNLLCDVIPLTEAECAHLITHRYLHPVTQALLKLYSYQLLTDEIKYHLLRDEKDPMPLLSILPDLQRAQLLNTDILRLMISVRDYNLIAESVRTLNHYSMLNNECLREVLGTSNPMLATCGLINKQGLDRLGVYTEREYYRPMEPRRFTTAAYRSQTTPMRSYHFFRRVPQGPEPGIPRPEEPFVPRRR